MILDPLQDVLAKLNDIVENWTHMYLSFIKGRASNRFKFQTFWITAPLPITTFFICINARSSTLGKGMGKPIARLDACCCCPFLAFWTLCLPLVNKRINNKRRKNEMNGIRKPTTPMRNSISVVSCFSFARACLIRTSGPKIPFCTL